MTCPRLTFRLAVLVCAGCALPAAMAGCGDAPPLDDPDAGTSALASGSAESRTSAIVELLRDAGGPEVARTMALQDATARMERAAPVEWAVFLLAAEAFQVAAPLEWRLFLWLFLSAAREAPASDTEQEAMRTAFDELQAEMRAATERARDAEGRSKAAVAVIAEVRTEAEMRAALAVAERWEEEAKAEAAKGAAIGIKALMVALVMEGKADEALARYARTVGTEYPDEYAAFLSTVEAVEVAAPDAWAEFVKVGALVVMAPTEAWR